MDGCRVCQNCVMLLGGSAYHRRLWCVNRPGPRPLPHRGRVTTGSGGSLSLSLELRDFLEECDDVS